ncbi:type II toxin-antitoxin system VapC family toxin [Sphingomonas sp. YL-JM2C]
MRGWLLDTNVIATLINPNGAPTVKAWAMAQPEEALYLSVLTLGEYDKGIHNLGNDHPHRSRYAAARDALEARFAARILPVSDAVVRRWGRISGAVKRDTGHAPSAIDTMLAATAMEYELFLSTRNVRDVSSSGAAIFNPWEDDPGEFPLS